MSGLLFALALAVQALAPMAAGVAMERGSILPSLEVCLTTAANIVADDTQLLAGRHDAKRDLCASCALCCGGVAPLAARPDPVGSAPVQWTTLVWTAVDRALPSLGHDHARQARGPPSFS